MKVTDRSRLRSTAVFAHLAAALRDLHPAAAWRWEETRRMTGTVEFRRLYEAGRPRRDHPLFRAGGPELPNRPQAVPSFIR